MRRPTPGRQGRPSWRLPGDFDALACAVAADAANHAGRKADEVPGRKELNEFLPFHRSGHPMWQEYREFLPVDLAWAPGWQEFNTIHV